MAEQVGDGPQIEDPAPDPVDATSIRYQIQAKTLAGDLYTVYILDAEYVGESTILQADETLIRFQKGEEDGTYEGGVIPTTADLFIRDKEPLAVLFGGDDKRFRAVVFKGDQIFMTGWLMPDFYERDPYNSIPATKLSIADGLHLLKDRSMQDVLEEAVSVADRDDVFANIVVREDGDNVLEPQEDWYRVRDILWALLPKGRAVERQLQYQVTVRAGDDVTTQLVGPASPTTSYRSGDGQEATGSEATFTYDEAGTYTITLGPPSIAPTVPLDIVIEWWAADTVFSNLADSDTEPLNRFAMSASHFQDDQGAYLSAFDGLQELCDIFGADFQQAPRPDQGASWLFRQRSVFAGPESRIVELSYVAITTEQDQAVTTQVVDESGRVTTFSADGFADVEGDEATFVFETPDQYEITLARPLDPDAQVWRYEDNVLTEDSPFTRVFGLDANDLAFDFQHTEQYERRLSSVVGIYHHEDLESIFLGGDFEDETTGDWVEPDYSEFQQQPSRDVVTLDSESRTPDSTQENEFAFRTQWSLELPDPDIYPLLTQSRTLPESTQRTFRVAHEGIIEQVEGRETERYIVTVGPLSLVNPSIQLDSEFETVKGDGVTYHLTDELPYPLPVGTKVPIVTFDDQDPPGSVVLTERAEAGDTTLTGDGDVTVREEDFESDGSVGWFPPRVQVFEWTDDPGVISQFFDEPGINTAFHKDAARDTYGDVEMIAPAPPIAGEVEVSYAWRPVATPNPPGPTTWTINADATIDNLQVGFPGAPDKTVSVAATDLQGDSLDISVSSGSGPLRDSPRRLLWIRDDIVALDALRVDRILIGTAFGDSGPLLSEAQALERLKQYNEHTRTLSLTTRRRLGERLIGGDEIISYDGRLWAVQRIVTQGRSQQLTLVAIQEDTLPTTTITRLTDDVDAVRIDEEINYASRR